VSFDQELAGHASSQCGAALLTGLAGVTQAYHPTFSANGDYAIVAVAIH
jgi:hypothetical protein